MFYLSFCTQTFEPLPTRQKVAELPEINWKGYIDSLQKVAKQRSTIYMHTRKQATKSQGSWNLVREEWREREGGGREILKRRGVKGERGAEESGRERECYEIVCIERACTHTHRTLTI